ncbi:lysoplasmalogenase [Paenibacillus sp. 481]|uniref:lysoplasmalogenase n=1 Tax=Paenibacillus sp. 481 TaxID=2835869 RepID=UPI001E3DEB27|nr:lysoplasmalogenase [Paenibacillus sp. 481]UHA71998.1 lysoplasmalogenase [Paenibacillus sp. 481]
MLWVIGIIAAVQLGLLASALWGAKPCVSGERRFPLAESMLLSISLVTAAAALYVLEVVPAYSLWIAIGMLFSFVGDLSMAQLLPWRNWLIGGMLTFGIGHVFYMIGFANMATQFGGTIWNTGFLIATFIALIVHTIGWTKWVRNDRQPRILNIGSYLYGLWVAGTAVFAFAMWWALDGLWWLPAIGGVLFVLSDLIIGYTDIGQRRVPNHRLWIWITYVAAQACIVYGALFATNM